VATLSRRRRRRRRVGVKRKPIIIYLEYNLKTKVKKMKFHLVQVHRTAANG
jgi:hypothetical protein